MIGTALDRLIGVFAPTWGASRMRARATMTQIEAFGSPTGAGYDAGKLNRLSRALSRGSITENAIPHGQLQALRAQSWAQYRNNPHARKIVRSLESKVVGRGMTPQSLATLPDGTPHVEFRRRAQELWHAVRCQLDDRGPPGYGGEECPGLAKLALRSTILSGDVLFHLRTLDAEQMAARGLRVPVTVQLIDSERLDPSRTTMMGQLPNIFRGIELDEDGRRVAYWLLDRHPSDPFVSSAGNESRRYPADQIGHLYHGDDVDQLRGVPWFAPALIQARDTADYQHNVQVTSAMAACFVAGYRRPSGTSRLGLEAPVGDDLTDADGNPITRLSPGMFFNLGRDGELSCISPQQPQTNAEAWIQHLIRSTATAFPGVKASTLTGDYRNSSFSSERSADNDCWPEIEGLQDWFSAGFYAPIYAKVIAAGVFVGWFAGLVDEGEFAARKADYTAATWQGPVARSINPVDDATAAALRVRGGTSSPQIEAGMVGRNWREILADLKEFTDAATALQIPEAVINQALGIAPAKPDQQAKNQEAVGNAAQAQAA